MRSKLFLMCTLAIISLQVFAQTIDQKVSRLLSQMTLEEKVGQMLQLDMYNFQNTKAGDTLLIDAKKLAEMAKKYQMGSILNTPRAQQAAHWARISKQIQEICIKNSRLKIPVLYGIDHIHGATYLQNAIIFPQNINTGATFDPSFASEAGKTTVYESGDLGHPWIFSPVLDLGKNPYFPRFYETYGEDPLVCARMGSAYIKGIQEHPEVGPYRHAACAKHFLGYSDPRSGWDRTPAEISEQNIQELFRPSFEAAIKAGVKTFMICSGEVNGVPVHGSKALLTDLLRNEMGFKGLVVTDWEDIILLHTTHRVAENEKEATYQAIMAGIDMSMTPYSTKFYDYLIELVKEGRIPMQRIDESVSRILFLKYDLNLFEQPYPRTDRFASRIRTPENQEKALQAARESIVLLKNQNQTLPFSKDIKTILVAGPNANSRRSICGGWSYTWQGTSEKLFKGNVQTVLEALQQEYPGIRFESITDTFTLNDTKLETFKQKAQQSDLILFVGGEPPYAEGMGNINDLSIDSDQSEMIQAIANTGKPSVVVLLEGRPRIVTKSVSKIPALIWAGQPGTFGAKAIAEILGGKVNPSGKLPFTYPSHTGHLVNYYKKYVEKKRMHKGFDTTYCLADFGHGLSYTQYKYSAITLSDTILKNEPILAKVSVQNVGEMTGKESVLWFITDEYRSITPHVKLLKHFNKKQIQPGETVTFEFLIEPMKDLSFRKASGELVVEPGSFLLTVGNQAKRFYYKP